jgi:lysophospholipid acyltransferase (LPLAT)-like uncharacterized protein
MPVPIAAQAAGLVGRALASTWRFVDARTGLRLASPQRLDAALYALWHEHLLPMAYLHREQGAMAMVSQHRDGEILARVLTGLGYRVARGSTSRGGSSAFRTLVRAGRSGLPVAVTPDGPRGPRRRAGPGATRVAAAAGIPVIPVAAAARRGWRLESWDRFLIPAPGTVVFVARGAPLDPTAAGARARLEAVLGALCEECETTARDARGRGSAGDG